jgi:hypothetical protein
MAQFLLAIEKVGFTAVTIPRTNQDLGSFYTIPFRMGYTQFQKTKIGDGKILLWD